VLEGDIKGCFDHISHEWLLLNVIIDARMLRKWLGAGVIEKNVFHTTEEGTPQGGIISPTLANITLDGMEALLDKYRTRKENGKTINRKVNLVRYADDFIITGESHEVLEEIKADLILFLKERGLELSEEKTLITHIDDGFDFLGFNIRKYRNGTLLIKPSEKSMKKFAEKTHDIIYGMRSRKQADVIEKLNRMIAGWVNYYRYVSSKKSFWRLDHTIFLQLWRWAIRRHQNKSLEWVRNKYWHRSGTRQWMYSTTRKDRRGKEYTLSLITLADTPLLRYTKVRAEANPFDPAYDKYFAERRAVTRQTRPLKRSA
jgi:RNA-directed DNA polymerase